MTLSGAVPVQTTTQTTTWTAQSHPEWHAYETRYLEAERLGGNTWNRDVWIKANPAPVGFVFRTANVIQKDAVVTHVQDKAVLGNIIEKKNVEVIHKPVVQEIHEQKIIELEKQNVLRNVQQDTLVQRSTDQTRYEEIGNRDLEAERLRLAQLNATGAPVVTRQAGATNEVHHGEVVAQVVRQEHIERHVQPVITEVREQNIVQEVVHPVVRKVQEETIIREVGSHQPQLLVFDVNTYAGDRTYLTWEQNMYNSWHQGGNSWNREQWILANPQPVGYKPTGFLNQYPFFNQYHSTLHTTPVVGGRTWTDKSHPEWHSYETRLLDAERHGGSSWNRDTWVKSNPAPAGYMFRTTPFNNTTYTGDKTHLAWEQSMYSAYNQGGNSWNREQWLVANPQPTGYRPTGFLNQYPALNQFHHTNVVAGGQLPKKPITHTHDAPLNPVPVTNAPENLKQLPTDGTVVPTTTLGETPAHTHEVLKGAAVGAAIGSVVPVVGTVVGGVVGAIGGAIAKHKHVKEGTHAFKE